MYCKNVLRGLTQRDGDVFQSSSAVWGNAAREVQWE